ncbi:MAG: hypothetical protein JF612_15155, partial [Planctomycetia bacterium]|nr:hypothetical protein [Planctomycetia bacterium]
MIASFLCLTSFAADSIAPIPRVLPPEGLEIPADVRSRLETGLTAAKKRLEAASEQMGRGPNVNRDRTDI